MQNPEAVNVTGTFNVCFSCFLLFWSIFSLILIPKLISTLYFILAKQSPPCDFRFGKKRQHLQLQCKKILLIQYAQACLRAGLSLTGSVFSFSQQFRIRFGSEAEGLYSLKFHYCRNSDPGFNEPYSFAVSWVFLSLQNAHSRACVCLPCCVHHRLKWGRRIPMASSLQRKSLCLAFIFIWLEFSSLLLWSGCTISWSTGTRAQWSNSEPHCFAGLEIKKKKITCIIWEALATKCMMEEYG